MPSTLNTSKTTTVFNISTLALNTIIIPIFLIGLNYCIFLADWIQHRVSVNNRIVTFWDIFNEVGIFPRYLTFQTSLFLKIMFVEAVIIFFAGFFQGETKTKHFNFKTIFYSLIVLLIVILIFYLSMDPISTLPSAQTF